ncbi:MAG TPA: SDR family oxidoreductase, partial [Tianweitania sediminis]|nr:SDR family oxidoreductase [Tianweitania sediminis]
SRWMKDGLGEEAFAGVARGFAEASALGDISSPEEIAAGAIFLACDATKMTGQLMTIDGGYTLGRAVKLS